MLNGKLKVHVKKKDTLNLPVVVTDSIVFVHLLTTNKKLCKTGKHLLL